MGNTPSADANSSGTSIWFRLTNLDSGTAKAAGASDIVDVGGEAIKWVMSALPVLCCLSKGLSDIYPPTDWRRDCLLNIESSAYVLKDRLEKIKDSDKTQEFEHQLGKLASSLEEIFSVLEIADDKGQQEASKYPQLQTIHARVSQQKDWIPNLSKILHSSHLNAMNTWKGIETAMERLTDELGQSDDNVDDTEESKLPELWRPPDEDSCEFVDRVFGAAICFCGHRSKQELRLRIGTYRRGRILPTLEDLCILLGETKLNSILQWHELFVDNRVKAKSLVTVEKHHLRGCQKSICICRFLEMHTRLDYRLGLSLYNDDLKPSKYQREDPIFQPETLQYQIDLKTLLSVVGGKWSLESKWATAVLLAYGLLYLYGGANFRGRWRRENIFFFHNGSQIPLQPFFGNPIFPEPDGRSESVDGLTFHPHPDILMLGVILLEIYLGQRLETFLNLEKEITGVNDFFYAAWDAFKSQQIRSILSKRYLRAIHACIFGGTFENIGRDSAKMRSELFRLVIRPLEEEMVRSFPSLDVKRLDEVAVVKCNLTCEVSPIPSTSFSIKISPSKYEVRNNAASLPNGGHSNGIPELATREIIHQAILGPQNETSSMDRSHPEIVIQEIGMGIRTDQNLREAVKSSTYEAFEENDTSLLFDAKTVSGGIKEISAWQAWLAEFSKFRNGILPDPIDPDNYDHRVRVTIIDTGIDGSHPFIRSKGWSKFDEDAEKYLFCDFSDGAEARDKLEPIDEDGHGTFVAGILLQIATNIELSVARIGSTREAIKLDVDIEGRIVRAINHATKTWESDIISLSFGSAGQLPELMDLIENVVNQGKIILASTGNSGNTRPISYPARLKSVFKIFATDMEGNMAAFSPPPPDDASYCFAIPGHQVMSTWPSNLIMRAGEDELNLFCWDCQKAEPKNCCDHSQAPCDVRTVMSGTSFATPIAAALVALIYQFYNVNADSPETAVCLSNKREVKFKTPEAVRLILTEMSRSSRSHPYQFLAPRFGREERLYFRKEVEFSKVAGVELNVHKETQVKFFSRRLIEVLNGKI